MNELLNKPLYRISWSTQEVETATLLDEHNMNDGASRETWLCKDSNGRKFTCSKGSWNFTEKAAWEEYSYDMENHADSLYIELRKAQGEYEKATNESLRAKQKVLELTAAQ